MKKKFMTWMVNNGLTVAIVLWFLAAGVAVISDVAQGHQPFQRLWAYYITGSALGAGLGYFMFKGLMKARIQMYDDLIKDLEDVDKFREDLIHKAREKIDETLAQEMISRGKKYDA